MKILYLAMQILSLSMLMGLLACTTLETPQKSNLTTGVVKAKIQKGITSQTEVLRLLGSPNLITKDKQGQEVWTYSRQSFKAETGGIGGSLILFGATKAVSSSASSSFDLIITFNNQNKVQNYSIVSSQF